MEIDYFILDWALMEGPSIVFEVAHNGQYFEAESGEYIYALKEEGPHGIDKVLRKALKTAGKPGQNVVVQSDAQVLFDRLVLRLGRPQ